MAYSLAGFTGQRPDPVSGHSHLGNGYRAYNPVLGYFTAPDSWSPFGIGGINPYAYCAGDPVNRADPSGHISGAGIAGMVMGAFGILMAPFTAGQSLTVMSCIIAGLEIVSGATAIATGVLEDSSPTASSVLGWVSLATGILSLGIGVARGGGKLADGAAGLARRLQRINGKIGIPMSGEFRNARFLGVNRGGGRVTWNISFEDDVPMGRRVTIMMGSQWENGIVRPVNEVLENGIWNTRLYTPAQLRNIVHPYDEHYDVYRLMIPNSASYSAIQSNNLANRLRQILAGNTPVVGFFDTPRATGDVAGALAHMNDVSSVLEVNGELLRWEGAENIVADLSNRYGNTAGAITFEPGGRVYPMRFDRPENNVNWQ
jgi:RHS repeat-associated protein